MIGPDEHGPASPVVVNERETPGAPIEVTCSECLRQSRVAHSQLELVVAMAMYWQDVGFDAGSGISARDAWGMCHAQDSYLDEARAFLGAFTQ